LKLSRKKDVDVADLAPTHSAPATDFTRSHEPFALFEAWMAEAAGSELNDPNAMSLATVDHTGMPNVRIVLLKGLDAADAADRGFVFYTNSLSAKGTELQASRKAALAFHWKSLGRQVRVRGTVLLVTDAEADAYYQSRPRGSRIGAWASRQSTPLSTRAELEAAVASFEATYPGTTEIPRPPHWTGFRVTPLQIEFWHDRPFRLHDRVVFDRPAATQPWQRTRLYP
jgi:pyridoxamine 5'-phosphate oxidase